MTAGPSYSTGRARDPLCPAGCFPIAVLTDQGALVRQRLGTNDWVDNGEPDKSVPRTPAVSRRGDTNGRTFTVTDWRDARGCLLVQQYAIDGMSHAYAGGAPPDPTDTTVDPKGPNMRAVTWHAATTELLARFVTRDLQAGLLQVSPPLILGGRAAAWAPLPGHREPARTARNELRSRRGRSYPRIRVNASDPARSKRVESMMRSLPTPGIEVVVTSQRERMIVHVSGQLDRRAVVALRRQLSHLPADARCLVLDFHHISFLGSAGVAFVEALAEQVRAEGGEMEVWGADDPRLRELQLSGGLRELRIQPSSDASSTLAVQERNRTVLREGLATAMRVTGAPMGNAQVLDSASGSLRIAVQQGFQNPFLSFFRTVEVEVDGSACGAAARQQRPVFVADVRSSPLFAGTAASEVLQDAGVRAVASLPVLAPTGALMGMVSTHCTKPTVWTPELRHELRYVVQAVGRLVR